MFFPLHQGLQGFPWRRSTYVRHRGGITADHWGIHQYDHGIHGGAEETRPQHNLYTIYTLYIHYIYTIYTLYIYTHYIYTLYIYTIYIYTLYIYIYTLYIYIYTYTIYTLYIYTYTIYTLYIHTIYTYILYIQFTHIYRYPKMSFGQYIKLLSIFLQNGSSATKPGPWELGNLLYL